MNLAVQIAIIVALILHPTSWHPVSMVIQTTGSASDVLRVEYTLSFLNSDPSIEDFVAYITSPVGSAGVLSVTGAAKGETCIRSADESYVCTFHGAVGEVRTITATFILSDAPRCGTQGYEFMSVVYTTSTDPAEPVARTGTGDVITVNCTHQVFLPHVRK